jgi:hypothetical protein
LKRILLINNGPLRDGSRWARVPWKNCRQNLKWSLKQKLQQVYPSFGKNEEKIERKNLKEGLMSKFISPSNIENFAAPGARYLGEPCSL